MNGGERYTCLKATLEAIASGHSTTRIDELMPWALTFSPIRSVGSRADP